MSGRQIAAAILAGIALLVGATFTTLWVLSLHRRNQALAEVEQLLDSNNFVNHRKAGRLMQQLGTRYPSDGRLWLEAARVDAQLALEFGAARNESAGRYLRRARDGGISKAKASPVQATLLLHQGELEQADLVLAAAGQLSDRDAAELVYLRGLWCLRRGQYEEAHKRLKAVEELPWQGLKRRGFVARAKAFMAQGDLAGARTLLGPPAKEPGNDIAQLLLQAHLALMEGEGLDEGAQAAEAVVTTKRKQAAPGQVAWAELLLARYGLAKQDRDLANTKIAAALKTRPVGDPLFGALLAETYLKLEDLDEAHEEAQKALKLAPTLPQLVTVYAETLFLRGETGEAERLLGGIDGTPEANLLLGRMALSRGETGEAKRALTLVKVASPLGAQAQLWLARVHLREGKAAKAVQILEPVLETDHPPQEVIMVLSKAYLELNQLAQAQSMLGRLAEERPDAPMISLNLGELYVRSASYEKAIPYLQKVVDSNPENASALALLGQAHEGLGHAAQATKLYKRALRLDNPPGEAVLGLVQVALAWGDLDRAEELLKRAPEDSPAGPLAMSQGMLALHRYQPGPALEALRKAVAARPDDPAVHALHGDALMAQESGVNLKAARRAYKKALTLSANYPPALVGLAEAALLSAKLRQAKKMLARTTRAMEQAATPPRLRARVLTLRGRYSFEVDGDSQQAVTLLQKAVELDDKLAETHLTLGFAQEDLGEGRKACHHFRTYLSLVAKGPAQDRQAAQGGVNEHCRN
jgi:tetratricopeptide (TPR) repeat protein